VIDSPPLSRYSVCELGSAPPAALCGSHLGALGMRVTAFRDRSLPSLALEWGWDWSKTIREGEPGPEVIKAAQVVIDATDVGIDESSMPAEGVYCRLLGDIDQPISAYPELIAQAATGLLGYVGRQDEAPIAVGVPVISHATGIAAVQAILAGLHHSLRAPGLVKVTVTMVRCALILMNNNVTAESDPDERIGFALMQFQAPDIGYRCSDGTIDFIFHLDDNGFRAFCEWVELDSPMWTDPRFDTYSHRQLHPDELRILLEPRIRNRSVVETLSALRSFGAICGQRHQVSQLLDHPQLQHLGIFTQLSGDSPRHVVQIPYSLNGIRPAARAPRQEQ
jgi:crotonobetainyl-CoA:carnitine CoA-transferase CaiB-like acyl-CoA transferase